MSDIGIEIVQDQRRPAERCAVILLRGVVQVPADTAYSIAPISGDDAELPVPEWPMQRREPEEIRTTESGIELVVARDISDRLPPGTRVAVEFPGLELRDELVWPDLEPNDAAHGPAHGITAPEHNDAQHFELPDPVSLQEAQQKLGTVLAQILKIEPRDGAAPRNGRHSADVAPPPLFPVSADQEIARKQELSVGDESWLADRPRILNTGRINGDGPGPWSKGLQDSPVNDGTDQQPERAPEAYALRPPHIDRVSRRVSFISLGLAATALFAIGGALSGAFNRAPVAASRSSVQTSVERGVRAKGSLSDVFSVPGSSPSGRARKDVDLDRALALADEHLHGEGAADRSEGEYWLRHALAIALGNERIKWALTQLGSAYAAGGSAGPVDYEKARLLWEMAGQLGDPVALCFIGALHEHGLGVPADKRSALAWYARAKQAGGCPAIDEALTRVSQ